MIFLIFMFRVLHLGHSMNRFRMIGSSCLMVFIVGWDFSK